MGRFPADNPLGWAGELDCRRLAARVVFIVDTGRTADQRAKAVTLIGPVLRPAQRSKAFTWRKGILYQLHQSNEAFAMNRRRCGMRCGQLAFKESLQKSYRLMKLGCLSVFEQLCQTKPQFL